MSINKICSESSLQELHGISLQLQAKAGKSVSIAPTHTHVTTCTHVCTQLEALDLVERAFVHVDYARRDQPEHRTERLLAGLPVVAEEPLIPPTNARSGSGRRQSSEVGTGGRDERDPRCCLFYCLRCTLKFWKK